jgi:hypothetical protein
MPRSARSELAQQRRVKEAHMNGRVEEIELDRATVLAALAELEAYERCNCASSSPQKAEPPRQKRERRKQQDRIWDRETQGWLLSPRVVAKLLGVCTDTLKTWRCQKTPRKKNGPPAIKQKSSSRVWYDQREFNLWWKERGGYVDYDVD